MRRNKMKKLLSLNNYILLGLFLILFLTCCSSQQVDSKNKSVEAGKKRYKATKLDTMELLKRISKPAFDSKTHSWNNDAILDINLETPIGREDAKALCSTSPKKLENLVKIFKQPTYIVKQNDGGYFALWKLDSKGFECSYILLKVFFAKEGIMTGFSFWCSDDLYYKRSTREYYFLIEKNPIRFSNTQMLKLITEYNLQIDIIRNLLGAEMLNEPLIKNSKNLSAFGIDLRIAEWQLVRHSTLPNPGQCLGVDYFSLVAIFSPSTGEVLSVIAYKNREFISSRPDSK